MTGLPPFYNTDKKKLYEKIMNEKITFPKNFNPILVDFLEKLLEKDPKKRLGSGLMGCEEIRKHKWFSTIDWGSLFKKELKPPFKPILKSDLDTSYFDMVFNKINNNFNILYIFRNLLKKLMICQIRSIQMNHLWLILILFLKVFLVKF